MTLGKDIPSLRLTSRGPAANASRRPALCLETGRLQIAIFLCVASGSHVLPVPRLFLLRLLPLFLALSFRIRRGIELFRQLCQLGIGFLLFV